MTSEPRNPAEPDSEPAAAPAAHLWFRESDLDQWPAVMLTDADGEEHELITLEYAGRQYPTGTMRWVVDPSFDAFEVEKLFEAALSCGAGSEKMRRERDKLRAALEFVESREGTFCPCCDADVNAHAIDCELGVALGRAECARQT